MKQVFTLFVLLCSFAVASGQGFTIENFDVKIEIDKAGVMSVIESIDVDFSEERRGIYREIPFRYKINGKDYRLGITDITVDNHPFVISSDRGNKVIRIGDKDIYLSGAQSYIIRYKVNGAILPYPEHQEIYWNITGSNWPTIIKNSSFEIALPNSLRLANSNLKVYTGKMGETGNNATINMSGDRIYGQITAPLQKSEGLTIAVMLPEGYLTLPVADEIIKKEINWWSALYPGALLFLLMSFWSRLKSTNKVKDDDVTEEYYPPEGFTSAQVGAFIDHKVDDRDIVSLIPYWASEGFIILKGLGEDVQIEKLKDLPDTYPDYEVDFFNALFKTDDVTSLSLLKNKTYKSYYKVKSDLGKEILEHDFYNPEYTYWFKSWRITLFGILLIIGGILTIIFLKNILIGICLIVFGVIANLLRAFTPPMSDKGWEFNRRLKGLKKFLENPDEEKLDKIVKEDPEYFNKILPYAVAFGLDSKWMVKFEKYYTNAPYWYIPYHHGHGGMSGFNNFSSQFQVKEITSAFKSAPAGAGGPSGGGGFSGGSSGGGFGGGGGGSW